MRGGGFDVYDCTGYYLEIPEIPQESDNLTEVFYISSESDHEKLLDALENRNGKIIIEVSSGTVLDDEGHGRDICGYYINMIQKDFQPVIKFNPFLYTIQRQIILTISSLGQIF